MSPEQTAAPIVYVVVERDEWPDSVWWTRGEADARVEQLRGEFDDPYGRALWVEVCEHVVGEVE